MCFWKTCHFLPRKKVSSFCGTPLTTVTHQSEAPPFEENSTRVQAGPSGTLESFICICYKYGCIEDAVALYIPIRYDIKVMFHQYVEIRILSNARVKLDHVENQFPWISNKVMAEYTLVILPGDLYIYLYFNTCSRWCWKNTSRWGTFTPENHFGFLHIHKCSVYPFQPVGDIRNKTNCVQRRDSKII